MLRQFRITLIGDSFLLQQDAARAHGFML